MPKENEETLETQVALVVSSVSNLTRSMDGLTAELRKTNDTVNSLHGDQRVMKMEQERYDRELFTSDNASRIGRLELHVRGIYAIVAFIGAAIGGELFALLSHWSAVLSAGGHR